MKKEMGLKELAKKYGTDKLDHGYIEYYEKYLPLNTVSLLEIGCYKGASVKMWKEYYNGGIIATFDLFKEFDVRPKLNELGILHYQGDASYPKDLNKIDITFDIIIDDASHNSHDQQLVFIYSMMELLNDSGICIIEDLHCCKDKFYWNRGIDKFEDTILWLFQNWTKEHGFPENKYLNLYTRNYINKIVTDVKLHDDKIAFIWKK